jgi:imidazolonepropionase
MKMAGAKYLDILAAGGGILSTVRATRAASPEQLLAEARSRLARMFAHGTTTAEAKTGYALETAGELKLLDALAALDAEGPLEIAPTFLGAHAVPPEFSGDPQGYTDLVCEEMLPAVKGWWEARPGRSAAIQRPPTALHGPSSVVCVPFVDVFCETGAFDLAQSRQILTRAQELGFPLKIHADEFGSLGGAQLAIELGAVSADHLVKTPQADIAALGRSGTAAVSLPCTPFGLAESEYTPAGRLIEAGAILAIATDLNPGTAWNESMQFVIALACRTMKLTPAQAIAAATINAAQAIGRADRIGSLEPGKQADLIVLSVPDYRQLGHRFGTNLVRQVIKRGQAYRVDSGYQPA